MHDLNTIHRINAASDAAARVQSALAAGRYAVTERTGLHLLDAVEFGSRADAERYVQARQAETSIAYQHQIHEPATAVA